MNILHLEASAGWGGQEIRILREAEGMRARGHKVLLAVTKGGGLVIKARNAGFKVYELNFRRAYWPICLFQLLLIMCKNRIDLVNTHSSLDSWIGGIAARIGRRAILRTRHLSTPPKPGINSRFVYGTLADFVVTTCASVVPIIVTQSGIPLERCRSIATGVDLNKMGLLPEEAESFREQIGFSPDDFVVGTACVMRSWKGIDDLLKAADILREEPHLKWVIIGGGHAQRHKKLAEELGLKNVFFTGHLDNPFAALSGLDLFALLSTAHEGVSQAILQAAYLGKPLLSTSTGGLSEVCIDQKTGLNVPIFSPQAVAAGVMRMKENRELMVSFGKAARELVIEKFTLNHTLDEMEEVYRYLEKPKKQR